MIPINIDYYIIFTVVIIWYCQHIYRKQFLFNVPSSVKKIVFTELGWCYVQLNNSYIFKADIASDTVLTEKLVILNLVERRSNDSVSSPIQLIGHSIFSKNQSVLLTADRLGCDKFREIKRHLRFISFNKTESD
ncbi:MAG: hypothetical protein OQL19_12495 [Gammaproteobacteria bacterium]|nr:hypothetical protein [Gammaproteobacteria bacterium]